MPTLIVEDAERTVLVDLEPGATVVLGRAHACDVPVVAPRVSRRHAVVQDSPGGFRVRDLGSTNGTRVNEEPLDGDRALCDGDVVDLGGCRVVFRAAPAAAGRTG